MAYPCTTAIDTNRGSRSQVKPRWNCSMAADASSSDIASSPATVSTPSPAPEGSSIARSSPAENVCPLPRTTTTRTSSATCSPIAASARHIAGVWALRTSGRSRVTTATSPVTS